MRNLIIIFFSLCLMSCDGLDFDSVDATTDSEEQRFSRSELSFNVVFSSSLLNDTGIGSREGFIALFNSSSELEEIELSSDSDVVFGRYPWTISNDELQVTYPDGVTCTSTKSSETSAEYVASASCSGGNPDNSLIRNTLVKAVSLDEDNVSGLSITINNEDNDIRVEFFDNGNFEIRDLDSEGDESTFISESGTYEDSTFTNVVKLNIPSSNQYKLWVLLDGGLSSGTMLELIYDKSTDNASDTLNKVMIYSISNINQWDAESTYTEIEIDE